MDKCGEWLPPRDSIYAAIADQNGCELRYVAAGERYIEIRSLKVHSPAIGR
jgi:hypothetical protein